MYFYQTIVIQEWLTVDIYNKKINKIPQFLVKILPTVEANFTRRSIITISSNFQLMIGSKLLERIRLVRSFTIEANCRGLPTFP